jgi:hypothetical protein
MSTSRTMNAPGLDISGLVKALSVWFNAQSLDVQQLPASGTSILLRCREPESWKTYIGMTTALNVDLEQSGSRMKVTLSGGKWIDKVIVAAVAFAVWPLFLSVALGAWKQKKLPHRTFSFIEEFVVLQSRHTVAPPSPHIAPTVSPISLASPTPNRRLQANGSVRERQNEALPHRPLAEEEYILSSFSAARPSPSLSSRDSTGRDSAGSSESCPTQKSISSSSGDSSGPAQSNRACNICGRRNQGVSSTCQFCGADMASLPTPDPSTSPRIACRNGHLNDGDRPFCAQCGKPLSAKNCSQ